MYVFAAASGYPANGMAGAHRPVPRMAGLAAAIAGFLQMTGSALYSMAVGHFYDGTARPMTERSPWPGRRARVLRGAPVERPPRTC